jgi:hypothetical protein
MGLSRPSQYPVPPPGKIMEINKQNREAVNSVLSRAARMAKYKSSPYHRSKGSNFGPAAHRRYPHASKCPSKWNQLDADRVLKRAIEAGNVSQSWINKFPRFVWYKDGDDLYEARLSNETLGEYHAYPLEDEREWPEKLRT